MVLRRARRVAATVLLLTIIGACASLRSEEQPTPSTNQTPLPPATAPPPAAAPSPPTATAAQGGWRSWFWPPDWSDWVVVAVAVWAAILARRSLRALVQQNDTARRSADAAMVSATAARDATWLAGQTFLDLTKYEVEVRETAGRIIGFHPKYRVGNISNNVARNVRISVRAGIGDSMPFSREVNYPALAPTKGVFVGAEISGISDVQHAACIQGTLEIRMQITVAWTDPFNRPGLNSFHRLLTQRPGGWLSNHLTVGEPDYSEAQSGGVIA